MYVEARFDPAKERKARHVDATKTRLRVYMWPEVTLCILECHILLPPNAFSFSLSSAMDSSISLMPVFLAGRPLRR